MQWDSFQKSYQVEQECTPNSTVNLLVLCATWQANVRYGCVRAEDSVYCPIHGGQKVSTRKFTDITISTQAPRRAQLWKKCRDNSNYIWEYVHRVHTAKLKHCVHWPCNPFPQVPHYLNAFRFNEVIVQQIHVIISRESPRPVGLCGLSAYPM